MHVNVTDTTHWGYGAYQYHREKFGEDFGYHDFIPMFTCEKFDPDEWADLFIKAGHFGGQSATMEYTASDVRFTRSKDGKALYIFMLGMPDANSELTLHDITIPDGRKIKSVTEVGSKTKMKFNYTDNKLSFTTPSAEKMNPIATVFEVKY